MNIDQEVKNIAESICVIFSDLKNNSFTLENAEKIAFSRFDGREISVEKAAILLDMHPNTVRSLIECGKLNALPRGSKKEHYRLIMSDVLKYDRKKYER